MPHVDEEEQTNVTVTGFTWVGSHVFEAPRIVPTDHHHQSPDGQTLKGQDPLAFLNPEDRKIQVLLETFVLLPFVPSGSFSTPHSLFIEVQSEERDGQIQESKLQQSDGAGAKEADTDAFQCSKCKQVTPPPEDEIQTSADADEPITVWFAVTGGSSIDSRSLLDLSRRRFITAL
ncbi:hypothetical protein BD410DRAFT_902407 [Rickenella mellea]|uniref:Uncharacterized protein n=1 Tax=Rickenella mellea TaxID=50990 RepID=A0A4Y7PMG4_9AGAM|nr:hypothetical protein BD410DRAFT_902407 [Rickenella mellea]